MLVLLASVDMQRHDVRHELIKIKNGRRIELRTIVIP